MIHDFYLCACVDPIIQEKYNRLVPILNERQRRLWGGSEASALGWGGISIVSISTGLSRPTIRKGIQEFVKGSDLPVNRIRNIGGGRKKAEVVDKTLKSDLLHLVDPDTRGDPESPLKWCSKSLNHLKNALQQINQNHQWSVQVIRRILREEKYTLQRNRKTKEGGTHPDRDMQFQYIQKEVEQFQLESDPVISIDAKKKEIIGNFKNDGSEWHFTESSPCVEVYDFFNKSTMIKATPYGVYDITKNRGFVNIGISYDTAVFAGKSILKWWKKEGKIIYPNGKKLLITADGGGSNSSRSRLWKIIVQNLADKLQIPITVAHYPPGTSKWNKIEHRLFSHISSNWRGVPLESLDLMTNLISHTTTKTGLEVSSYIDHNEYKKGIRVPDKWMKKIRLERHEFHGEWNYTVYPKSHKFV
jgi:Rhodopirellula transposase DDE domain